MKYLYVDTGSTSILSNPKTIQLNSICKNFKFSSSVKYHTRVVVQYTSKIIEDNKQFFHSHNESDSLYIRSVAISLKFHSIPFKKGWGLLWLRRLNWANCLSENWKSYIYNNLQWKNSSIKTNAKLSNQINLISKTARKIRQTIKKFIISVYIEWKHWRPSSQRSIYRVGNLEILPELHSISREGSVSCLKFSTKIEFEKIPEKSGRFKTVQNVGLLP